VTRRSTCSLSVLGPKYTGTRLRELLLRDLGRHTMARHCTTS